LDQALEAPVAQRDAWFDELESREPRIAADIRRLLAAQSTTSFVSFLNEPVAPTPAAHALAGEWIGSFRILRELGEGGMAVLYLAAWPAVTHTDVVDITTARNPRLRPGIHRQRARRRREEYKEYLVHEITKRAFDLPEYVS
jgi:hypothetical protein